jgi:hypothetical protein
LHLCEPPKTRPLMREINQYATELVMGKLGACYSATLVVNSQIRCLNEEYCVEVNKFENMLMIWMQDQLLITELTCCL